MKNLILLLFFLACVAQAQDPCQNLYGKHRLLYHSQLTGGPEKYSEPIPIDIEFKRNGTYVIKMQFIGENTVFSPSKAQFIHTSGHKKNVLNCSHSQDECETIREYALGHLDFLYSLEYVDAPEYTKKMLDCATESLENIAYRLPR